MKASDIKALLEEQTALYEKNMEAHVTKLETHFTILETQVASIKRGFHGDEENDQPGALKRLSVVENTVAKILESKKRIIAVSLGVIGTVQLLGFIIYELILRLYK